MRKPLEKDIQKVVMDWLHLRGALPIRINSGAMQGSHKGKKWFMRFTSEPGCADILCAYQGRFLAVEIKRPGGSTDPERKKRQDDFAEKVRRAGGIALTVTGLDDLVKQLTDAGVV